MNDQMRGYVDGSNGRRCSSFALDYFIGWMDGERETLDPILMAAMEMTA